MEKNKINFITGETYTLAELFSGNRRIVIPDLQRDYCWGDETNQKNSGKGELVTDFIKNLIEQHEDNKQDTLNLGLFYGYEVPANHIQLCDGQQRLTTLYLLLGMLNKKVGKFQQYLISDFEYYHDDKEPYLNYAIRESSLYFLSDLVCKFFISNDDNVDSITKADWYFNDYNLDPSICSMINALKKIEIILDEQENKLDYGAFGDWVLNKLTFLYFDMENRKNGEETFVIINTTGEPLSATQNLKPLVINANVKDAKDKNQEKEKIGKRWEDMETWFWNNRIKGAEHTADEGMEIFFHLVRILYDYKTNVTADKLKEKIDAIYEIFPYNDIEFKIISDYFEAYKKLYRISFSTEQKQQTERFDNMLLYTDYENINKFMYIVLPMLCYCHRFHDETTDDDIKRMFHLFSNMQKHHYNNPHYVTKSSLDIILSMNMKDIDSLIDNEKLIDEEKRKLRILSTYNGKDRENVEYLFAEAENHDILSGKLSILLEWSEENVDSFRSLFEKMKHIWNQSEKNQSEIFKVSDLFIRALLTYKPYNYPFQNYTLWPTSKDWYNIFECNKEIIKSLIDKIDKQDGVTNYDNTYQTIINEYENKGENIWYPIIKNPDLLINSSQKIVGICENNITLVMDKAKRGGNYTIIFYGKVLRSDEFWQWGKIKEYRGLLFADHEKVDLTVELIHEENANGFSILLWSGKNIHLNKFCHLEEVAKKENFVWNNEKEIWQTRNEYSGDEVIKKMKDIVCTVNSYIDKDVNDK